MATYQFKNFKFDLLTEYKTVIGVIIQSAKEYAYKSCKRNTYYDAVIRGQYARKEELIADGCFEYLEWVKSEFEKIPDPESEKEKQRLERNKKAREKRKAENDTAIQLLVDEFTAKKQKQKLISEICFN